MEELYTRIDNSYIMIIGTVIFVWATAQTKLLLDRFRPYYVNKNLKVALIFPAGKGSSNCDLTIEMVKRSLKVLGDYLSAVVTLESYDASDSYKDKHALQNIEKLEEKLV